MRLLNTSTLKLEDFTRLPPPYVILSHTWGKDEITIHDLSLSKREYKRKLGYAKLAGFCRKARDDGYDYGWIDTCCIDKTNSVELSEAINSMYRWYEEAEICYAYLSDVDSSILTSGGAGNAAFRKSRWFTRGWTLQELLAPATVEFYTRDWREVGTKLSLIQRLADITGIHSEALSGRPLSTYSAAAKLSWAARRQTTRIEDAAYCLLGIFQVNMPLIYGEGTKAFWRLQGEILRLTEDYSVLAWGLKKRLQMSDIEKKKERKTLHEFLAHKDEKENQALRDFLLGLDEKDNDSPLESPVEDSPVVDPESEKNLPPLVEDIEDFYPLINDIHYSDIENTHWSTQTALAHLHSTQPVLTSRGLRITLPIAHWKDNIYFASINTLYRGQLLCLLLRRSPASPAMYNRISVHFGEAYHLFDAACAPAMRPTALYIVDPPRKASQSLTAYDLDAHGRHMLSIDTTALAGAWRVVRKPNTWVDVAGARSGRGVVGGGSPRVSSGEIILQHGSHDDAVHLLWCRYRDMPALVVAFSTKWCHVFDADAADVCASSDGAALFDEKRAGEPWGEACDAEVAGRLRAKFCTQGERIDRATRTVGKQTLFVTLKRRLRKFSRVTLALSSSPIDARPVSALTFGSWGS